MSPGVAGVDTGGEAVPLGIGSPQRQGGSPSPPWRLRSLLSGGTALSPAQAGWGQKAGKPAAPLSEPLSLWGWGGGVQSCPAEILRSDSVHHLSAE